MRSVFLLCLVLVGCYTALGQTQTPPQRNYPAPVEGDYVIQNFRFHSGESLPELKMHYRTIGTLTRDAAGVANNAVLIGHGTGGSGTSLLNPIFANVLFGPGQLLDATKYFIVMQVDGAGWHHAHELVIPENIRLIEQPPYSPEVNPVEHVWDELREKYFHNRVFPSLEALMDVLCQALNDLADDPERLRSLTNFPHLHITI